MRIALVGLLLLIGLSSYGQKKLSKKDYVCTISTEYGDMKVILYDETPIHKANFIKLAKKGFYDSTTFHRVIQRFMIQGGDPNSKNDNPNDDGQGGPGYTLTAEINTSLCHKKGALSAARLGDGVNPEKASSGSQFYIVQGDKLSDQQLAMMERRGNKYSDAQKQAYKEVGGTPHLDGGYTVFGEVIFGLDVIDKIAAQPKNRGDKPTKNVYMTIKVEKLKRGQIESLKSK